jgi:hypothetical protein
MGRIETRDSVASRLKKRQPGDVLVIDRTAGQQQYHAAENRQQRQRPHCFTLHSSMFARFTVPIMDGW